MLTNELMALVDLSVELDKLVNAFRDRISAIEEAYSFPMKRAKTKKQTTKRKI